MSRVLFFGLLLLWPLAAQSTRPAAPPANAAEEEPPEEDPDLKPKVYDFNPLEAGRNITAGNFYYKKGNYRAAMRRYAEAIKWDPTSSEALLKLASAEEKLHDFAAARETYTKLLTLDADSKAAAEVRKRLEKLPVAKATGKKDPKSK
ncbi:MAG: tetratricopeptide repeat protein [Bryobacteraceae bacterium]